jgi:hypothetical protein
MERPGAIENAEVFAQPSAIRAGRAVSGVGSAGNRAMSERAFWLSAIVMLGLFGAGGNAPASARGSGHGGSSHGGGISGLRVHGSGVHRFGAPALRSAPGVRVPSALIRGNLAAGVVHRQHIVGNDLLRRRGDRFENGRPIGIWPFWPDYDPIPMVGPSSGSDGLASPSVIVVSGSPNSAPERTASATLPDYSYVAGCHAIPNGYHCDVPHDEAAH